jgi:hypothetical protein
MYEPVTIARVRKDTTVTVPAGSWILLCGPDKPLSEHIAKRTALVRDGAVNEDFEQLHVGRIQDTNSPVRFVTAKEKSDAEKAAKENEKALAKSNADAKKRQSKIEEEQSDSAQKAHEEKVAQLNQTHDAIRYQGVAPVTAKEKSDAEKAAETGAA